LTAILEEGVLAMDVKYINPFLGSVLHIVPQFGIADIKKSKISVKGKELTSPGVMIILGIIGDVKGNVIYGMGTETAKSIASAMMMGMPVPELDDLAQSAISELTNMLTATAATNFYNEGININISTPTLMYGDFTANTNSDKTICVEMLLNGNPFEINISLEEV
jgi:chemotaxis protein CheX